MQYRLDYNISSGAMKITLNTDTLSTTVKAFQSEFIDKIQNDTRKWTHVTIDLTKSKMIDAAGIKLVLSLMNVIQTKNIRPEIMVKNAYVLKILNISLINNKAKLVLVE
ncbi:MAG: STAS domain-containing protein [Verrucomicrobiota bacterium]